MMRPGYTNNLPEILTHLRREGFIIEPNKDGYLRMECPLCDDPYGDSFRVIPRTQSFYCNHCATGGKINKFMRLWKEWSHNDVAHYFAKLAKLDEDMAFVLPRRKEVE